MLPQTDPHSTAKLETRPTGSADAVALDRECSCFTDYLIGERPAPYVLAKYRDAHARAAILNPPERQVLDRALLCVATKHKYAARLADTYAALLARDSIVRKKLTLLLAILETSPRTFAHFETTESAGRMGAWIALLGQAAGFALTATVAVAVFAPLHACAAAMRRRRRRSSEPGG